MLEQDKNREALLHDNTISPRDDRRLRGQALKASIPLNLHATWEVPKNRPDPIELLDSYNTGRVPELVPIRWGRMLASPFTFFRGAAALMASDMADAVKTGIRVQACGDCHLLNFGAFATPERNIVFDLNDFDETLPAPWEWDVKRLATSFVLVARDNGAKAKYALEAAEAVARSYRVRTAEYSRMSILDIWYARIDWPSVIEQTSNPQIQKERKKRLKEAMKRTIRDHYFPKLTEEINGQYLIKDHLPTIFHMAEKAGKSFKDQFLKAVPSYRESLQEDKRRLFDRYKLADVAIKVVGIGSVGTVCAVALMLAPDNEPLFLQLKEANMSVLEPFWGKSEFENHGQRVVAGQRIVQAASDIFLGWTKFEDGRHFYIRQLRDTKVKPEAELWEGEELVEIAEVMGATLARAHARSGDAAQISGYLGEDDEFDRAIADFATTYADQAEKDHTRLVAAVRSGRLKAQVEEED
jgi:uncharacterized protein (DUF2252 family)